MILFSPQGFAKEGVWTHLELSSTALDVALLVADSLTHGKAINRSVKLRHQRRSISHTYRKNNA
jgi:hypothetical protein